MRRHAWVIVCLVVAFDVALIGSTRDTVAYQPQADEGYYLRDAIRIAEGGPGAFPELFRDYLRDADSRRYFPSPVRLTTILLDAVAIRLTGPTFRSLQQLSLAAFLALLVLTFLSLSRTLDGRTASWTTLLLAVSPLHLAMARRALADSLVATLLVGCLCLFIRTLTAKDTVPNRRWWCVAIAYAFTFLAKEGTVILIPISLILIAWRAWRHRRRPPILSLCAVSLLPAISALLLVSLAAGGFSIAWRTLCISVTSASTNPYAMQYGSGPWFRYIVDYLLLSPWTTLLYVVWLGYLIGARVQDERVWAWALVPILFIACSAPITKNVRYALALEAPIRLGATLLLQRLAGDSQGMRWASVRVAMLIAGFAWMDLQAFSRIFLIGGLYDPASVWLLNARHFLPR